MTATVSGLSLGDLSRPAENAAAAPISFRRRLLWGIVVSAMTLVLLDAAIGILFCRDGEFLGRRLPPFPLLQKAEQLEWLRRGDWPYYQFDARLGWTIRPHGVFDGGKYRANSDGIRADRKYTEHPPDGVLRLAAFGDSFTHGDSVENSETMWAQMEHSRPDTEILNFGVPGYGTDQAYLRFLHEGARFHPHVVVVGFMLENIQRNVSVFRPAYYPDTGLPLAKPRFEIRSGGSLVEIPCPVHSREQLVSAIESDGLLDSLTQSDYWVQRASLAYTHSPLFWSSLAKIAYSIHAGAGRNYADHYRHVDGEPFRVTSAVLRRFHRAALDTGASRCVVVIFPDKATLRDLLNGAPRYWTTLTDALCATGVESVDITDDLLAEARPDGVEAFFNGTHYNARGNAVAASALEDALLHP